MKVIERNKNLRFVEHRRKRYFEIQQRTKRWIFTVWETVEVSVNGKYLSQRYFDLTQQQYHNRHEETDKA